MTWGISTDTFLQIHVVLSLIGIASGLVVMYGLLDGKPLGGSTALFLATTILTCITGFPLPPFGWGHPARQLAMMLLVGLSVAIAARYVFHLARAWRWIYIVIIVDALYANVDFGMIQAFDKLPFLQPLAPTLSEAPFRIPRLAVLAIFVILAVVAVVRFHPMPAEGIRRA